LINSIGFEVMGKEELSQLIGRKFHNSDLGLYDEKFLLFPLSVATYIKSYYSLRVYVGALASQELKRAKHKAKSRFYLCLPARYVNSDFSGSKARVNVLELTRLSFQVLTPVFVVGKSTLNKVYLRSMANNTYLSAREIYERANAYFDSKVSPVERITTKRFFSLFLKYYQEKFKKPYTCSRKELIVNMTILKRILKEAEVPDKRKLEILEFFFKLNDNRPKNLKMFYTFYQNVKHYKAHNLFEVAKYANLLEFYDYKTLELLSELTTGAFVRRERERIILAYKDHHKNKTSLWYYLEKAVEASKELKAEKPRFCWIANSYSPGERVKACGCYYCMLEIKLEHKLLKESLKNVYKALPYLVIKSLIKPVETLYLEWFEKRHPSLENNKEIAGLLVSIASMEELGYKGDFILQKLKEKYEKEFEKELWVIRELIRLPFGVYMMELENWEVISDDKRKEIYYENLCELQEKNSLYNAS